MPRSSKSKLAARATRRKATKCKICGTPVKDDKEQTQSRKDIPGYYYDTEKKRYFKITSETKEKLKTQPRKQKKNLCEKCTKTKEIQDRKRQQNSSLVKNILSLQYGLKNPYTARRETLERLVANYDVIQKTDIGVRYADPVKCAVSIIEPDLNAQKLVTRYNTLNSDNQIVQFHQIEREKKNKLTIVPGTAMMKNQAVTSLNWSPHSKTSNFVLLSLLGQGGIWGEGLLFHVDGVMQTFVSRYPMNRHSVWTSAWNKNPLYDDIISMGASKMALTFDVNTRKRMLRLLCNSDVLSQDFATQSPVLFNGFRNGNIRSFDIRLTGSRVPCMFMSQDKPITSLKLLRDENYLLVSGMDETIRRWDLRMLKVVQEYHGHCNTMSLNLSFFVDPTESLIFAAGEDSVTRVWSISTGDIVRTIPYPTDESTQIYSIPALTYAEQWGGPGGLPGLMYGTNEVVRWYAT